MSDTLTNALAQAGRTSGIQPPATLNPLAGMGSAMDMIQKVQGLDKSLAEQRAGLALQGAINPQGEFDPNAARTNLKNDPSTAYATGTTLSNVQNISSNQLEQARAKAAWVNSSAGSLTRLGPSITPQDALGVLRQGLTSGLLTQPEYERQAAEVAALGNDPAKLNAWANQHQFNAMSVDKQLTQTFGAPFKQTGPGGVTIGGTQNERTGAVSGPAGQPGLPQGMSQEFLNEPVTVTDPRKTLPDGSPNPQYLQEHPIRRGDLLGTLGVPGTGPAPAGTLGTGRIPPALQNPARAGQATPATPATPAAPIVTKVGPGDAAMAVASGPKFDAAISADEKAQSQHAVLGNMLADTAQFVPGPGAAGTEKFKAIMTTWAPPIAKALGIDPSNVAAQQSFDKLAAQMADAQGAGSDARLGVIQAATPHSGLTKEGVDLIIRQLQGNSDYLRYRARLAQAYPNRSDYQGFQDSIRQLDPRVFQMERMTQPQRETYLKSLDGNAKQQLVAALNFRAEQEKKLAPGGGGG